MTLAWLLIDALGRRKLLIQGSMLLAVSFLILTVFGGLSENSSKIDMSLVELSLICIQVPSVSGGWQRSG
jgi:hypothetical protein